MIGESALAELALGASRSSALPSVRPIYKTLISQYTSSPTILALVESLSEYFDPLTNFDLFFSSIWDVDNAGTYGLDVWGRIVGVSRVLHLPSATGKYIGFNGQGSGHSFGHGIWFNGQNLTSNYSLSDSAYRRLILAKALFNICDGSVPAINQILINLFSQYGNCYVIDHKDMTMTYLFGAALTPVDLAIVTQSGALPKPAGVRAIIQQR